MRLTESIADFDNNEKLMYSFAKNLHDKTGALRKHSNEPYFVHPEGVAKVVKAYGGTKLEILSSIAHDTLEDTGITWEDLNNEFGEDVADIVNELTNDADKIKKFGKELYMNLKLVRLSKSALFVKLADILYNILDYPNKNQKQRIANNIKYLTSHKKIDCRHKELVDAIYTAM